MSINWREVAATLAVAVAVGVFDAALRQPARHVAPQHHATALQFSPDWSGGASPCFAGLSGRFSKAASSRKIPR